MIDIPPESFKPFSFNSPEAKEIRDLEQLIQSINVTAIYSLAEEDAKKYHEYLEEMRKLEDENHQKG